MYQVVMTCIATTLAVQFLETLVLCFVLKRQKNKAIKELEKTL